MGEDITWGITSVSTMGTWIGLMGLALLTSRAGAESTGPLFFSSPRWIWDVEPCWICYSWTSFGNSLITSCGFERILAFSSEAMLSSRTFCAVGFGLFRRVGLNSRRLYFFLNLRKLHFFLPKDFCVFLNFFPFLSGILESSRYASLQMLISWPCRLQC